MHAHSRQTKEINTIQNYLSLTSCSDLSLIIAGTKMRFIILKMSKFTILLTFYFDHEISYDLPDKCVLEFLVM